MMVLQHWISMSHQTPSLCPFRADSVLLQIQVDQSRVLFEAFGQGLTGEIRWTSSPALEWIKLWVILFLPSFSRISPVIEPRDAGHNETQSTAVDGFGMQYVSFNLKFVHICSQTALERYLPKINLYKFQPIWPPQNNQRRITVHL